jgi:regulator of RNase E activity RraA
LYGPGEIGYPVSCGGLPVMPGDLIAADEDGIVVIPREDAAAVVAAAEAHARKEHETIRGIDEGRADRAWVRKLLTDKAVTRS